LRVVGGWCEGAWLPVSAGLGAADGRKAVFAPSLLFFCVEYSGLSFELLIGILADEPCTSIAMGPTDPSAPDAIGAKVDALLILHRLDRRAAGE
jgi:hypothetical protein